MHVNLFSRYWTERSLGLEFGKKLMSKLQPKIAIQCEEQSVIVKLPSNFLHLTKHTRETEEELEIGPVPALSYVQNGGPVDT